jgi:exo-beta-1,3-glucanase (GH17 family)
MDFYGICFEPYVGPFDGSQPVLFNAYSLADVEALLAPVAAKFTRIRTYGQGTFVWQGNPIVQDSNKFNIQAAASNGLKVTAGCFQQGANPQGDSINVAWTKTEIDYAIAQAQQYGNVDELVVGNECLWGPNSTGAVVKLMNYAKLKRKAAGFTKSTLPVVTCQRWDVLAGVNNLQPSYASMRKALLSLLNACEGFVYANMYAYFDPQIASKTNSKTPKAKFISAVTASMAKTYSALSAAFKAQKIAATIRLGETGWPTQGVQAAQPSPIASVQMARWYVAAMKAWLPTRAFLFEAYDEPWKGDQAGDNSEAFFGVWKATGTSTDPGNYVLTGEVQKYPV